MGIKKPYHIHSDIQVLDRIYKKINNEYVKIGDNFYIRGSVNDILSIPESSREIGELYFSKDVNEYFRFAYGITDDHLLHVPTCKVNEYTILSGNSISFPIGNTMIHTFTEIEYSAYKGSLFESGTLRISNLVDTIINRTSQFDDAGLEFSKSVSSETINIVAEDISPDSNDITISFSIKHFITLENIDEFNTVVDGGEDDVLQSSNIIQDGTGA